MWSSRSARGAIAASREVRTRVQPDLDGFARRFGDASTGAESASDLAQEAALRLWEKLAQFQGNDDDNQTAAMLHDWLEQLVRRLAANRREARHGGKRRPHRPLVPLDVSAGTDSNGMPVGGDAADGGPTPSAVAGAREADVRVRAALEALTDAEARQVLRLCFVDGLSRGFMSGAWKIGTFASYLGSSIG